MPALRHPPLRVWVWAAATVAVAVVATLLWRGSDAAATTSTTAAPAAAPSGAPAATVARTWSAADDPRPGGPSVTRRRVVVGAVHGLTALDPATGHPAWRYTRSNARLCGVTTVDGYAVAVFTVPHERRRCDQMVALSVDTGVRMWTRNVDFTLDAALTGTDRSDQAPGSVLAHSATGLVDIDPAGDNIRWRYHAPPGCRLSEVTAGTSGMAFVQRCPGAAPQLRLVDGTGGGVRWTADLAAQPAPHVAGADGAVAVASGRTLSLFDANTGHPLGSIGLPAAAGNATEVAVSGLDVVSAGGAVTAVDPRSGGQRWQQPAVGAAGTVAGDGGAVVVPEGGAFVVRDAATGAERRRSAVADLPAGGAAAVVGAAVVYRLPGRVLGYR